MSKYLNSTVVGIDVASEFSFVSILCPDGHEYKKPFKIVHSANSYKHFLQIIKKVEEEFGMKPTFFMESTGMYHLTLLHFLSDNGFSALVINPLVTHSNRNVDIRKVKSDKTDAFKIAKLAKYSDIKVSCDTDAITFEFKQMVRNYYRLIDDRSSYKKQIGAYLSIYFSGYNNVFSDICSKASIAILKKYNSPSKILHAPKEDVLCILDESKKGTTWSEKKYKQLLYYSENAVLVSLPSLYYDTSLQSFISLYEAVDHQINQVLSSIDDFINSGNLPKQYAQNLLLLQSITGIGYIGAITLLAEVGNFDRFPTPKQLVAFIGIDPAINQSGNFTADKVRMSKRGSRLARRALFAAALSAVRCKDGIQANPVIYKYYTVNLKGKKKKVALIAVMHKLVKYIFAVIRDQKPYQFRDSTQHQELFYAKNYSMIA